MSEYRSQSRGRPSHYDWHQADIIAALRKRGTTLAAVSREAGLSSSTLANTLSRPWPKGEWIIANYLEIHPSEIWPSRYFDMCGQLIERKARKNPTNSSLS
ncbi:helix-turn-helix domain-containing protein [Xenorhabdus kozodoii]|uniref:helix-turn-helix domain-containing protein n=1 Tax=Xenorhabdus kozodoii TaxID=351676 RepID=UPI000C05421B|nr:helix-turn-helix transcriptional regulator [Xenorhabdus kozodoii]